MEYRNFGKSNLEVSVLGFGCGAVGGLMVHGEHEEMIRSVEYALEAGVNYFDTARMYGDGLSEIHTGGVLRELGAREALVGTKVRILSNELGNIEEAISRQIDNSLLRLGSDCVDIVYTHNRIAESPFLDDDALNLEHLESVVNGFEAAVKSGKIRYWGFNGLGETDAIKRAVEIYKPSGLHTCYNMLNPSSGSAVSESFPYQNYDGLIDICDDIGVGTVAIRILAAGALTGSTNRHALAAQDVAPIATGKTLKEDVDRTALYKFIVEEGYTENLVEASLRFAISNEKLSTALVGLSSLNQLKQAVEAIERGPLDPEVLDKLRAIWSVS